MRGKPVRDFEYLEPNSISDASRLLAEYDDDCRLIAGGTALILALRQRMLAPTHLISLAKIESMSGISVSEKGELRIGSRTKHAEIASSDLVQSGWPMLADMASCLANPQVRNQGTIGGNLCYADPATDPPGCLLALDAVITLVSSRGERQLPIDKFIIDFFETAIEADEVLAEIIVPKATCNSSAHIRHLRIAAEHRPMLNLSIALDHDGDQCRDIRFVIGAAVPVCSRITSCEEFLKGKVITSALAAEAGDIVASEMNAISDMRGTDEYRRDIACVVTRRALSDLFGLKEG